MPMFLSFFFFPILNKRQNKNTTHDNTKKQYVVITDGDDCIVNHFISVYENCLTKQVCGHYDWKNTPINFSK